MADETGRVEAAAGPHWTTHHSEYLIGREPRYWVTCRCGWVGDDLPDGNLPTTHRAEVAHYLAAADRFDREHGIARIKLDYALTARIAAAICGDDTSREAAWGLVDEHAAAVMAVLREAADDV